MPTKPNPVTDLPPSWGGAGNYTPGVYGPTLPWGDANPLAGQPLPWGNQPRLNSTGLAGFANTGLTPQIPTDASLFNEWLRRVGIWATDWVALGTSADDADAHIMETDASGFSAAVKYIATAGIEGAGATPVILAEGASVPAGKTLTLDGTTTANGALNVLGAAGGSLSSDPTAVLQWNGEAQFTGRLRVLAGTSIAEGDLSKSGGNLRYRDSTATRYVHASASGWFKGVGVDASSGPIATAAVDTSTSVAPLATSDVHVSACGWVSRAGGGSVTISVIAVGIGQIGTSTVLTVPATAGTTFQAFTIDRIRAGADTTPRVYRLEVAGGGANVTTRNLNITATPGAS